MPSLPVSIQELFDAHQARLTVVAAAPRVSGLSPSFREVSATCLSQQIKSLVKPQYESDCGTGTTPEEKIAKLAASVASLTKQVKPLAPSDAFYAAFTTGSLAAAQEVFLSIFSLSLAS